LSPSDAALGSFPGTGIDCAAGFGSGGEYFLRNSGGVEKGDAGRTLGDLDGGGGGVLGKSGVPGGAGSSCLPNTGLGDSGGGLDPGVVATVDERGGRRGRVGVGGGTSICVSSSFFSEGAG
jgi:hypothetical protein